MMYPLGLYMYMTFCRGENRETGKRILHLIPMTLNMKKPRHEKIGFLHMRKQLYFRLTDSTNIYIFTLLNLLLKSKISNF